MLRLISFLLFLLISSSAWATTYYVRNDGTAYGTTSTTCNGQTDAAYVTNNGPNCAVSHPVYILGSGSAGVFAAGDTMIIDNIDENAGSGQAKYVIGYTMPSHTNCNPNADDYDCVMQDIPSGVDSSHKTKIYGKGYASCTSTTTSSKAQLYGQGRLRSVLNLSSGGNIDIQCLDITDHLACAENHPVTACTRTGVGATDGDWAETGIAAFSSGTTNVNIQNTDIHGLAAKGIFAYRIGDWTVTNTNIVGNGYVGWDSDGTGDDSYTGTVILDKTRIAYSGCIEAYPRSSTDWRAIADISGCWDSNQGGFGDGIGLGDGSPGNWTIKNGSDISFNASDGVDLLHGNGTSGTIIFERSIAEGNIGNQFKGSVLNNYIENSLIIGNCGFIKDNNLEVSGAFVPCRANGDTIVFSNLAPGQKMYINNSTIISNGDSAILSGANGAGSATACDGTTILQVRNSIFRIGRQWGDDSSKVGGGGNDTTGFYYASGNDGNGGGTCGSLNVDEDYDIIYTAKTTTSQCGVGPKSSAGTHSLCASDPVFTVTPSMGPTTYITSPSLITNFYIQVTSPAINLGLTTITTLQDGSADYNSFARGAQWDSGSFEYGTSSSSCSSNGVACSTNSDCCSNICSSSICSAGGGGSTIGTQYSGSLKLTNLKLN